MKNKNIKKAVTFLSIILFWTTFCASASLKYTYKEYPLERNGIALHLDCMKKAGSEPQKNILLIHGVTYSSHEFDIDYKDYSLVRYLASQGYAVWRLDIAGFGQSGEIKDGFMPDSDYAAEDINAEVTKIIDETRQQKIDILGWSWGTVTTSRFAAKYPDHINKIILYAPIMSGLGAYTVTEDFHHNTWEHAADDFQKKEDGSFDYSIAEAAVIEIFCSNCWHYDRETSPNGGRKDLCVPATEKLISLEKITVPTLIICGDKDPYLNFDLIKPSLSSLPQDSALEIIKGASHVMYIEKPFYHDFQKKILKFLND